ncbi:MULTISPECIES: response regulator transcription factor [Streptomyces]|uniref:Two component transcriptional regulator n=1 Tax=Streptomyces sviceus (strain ATCC 29083 / DSM 924 / JCM 4929 / NBRC 13980 / NCIMB 11184 / NRRL 5439 / UC 5370) TaxID=463191 RepID=B5I095_STRX2|nr:MULTISPECIES: response regulator transcription factor [Streptomyces]EDY58500.1 two component transcriptional regulator [Streptomyces sviceus ATCC 29083]MYT09477.1 response regulator [Streptomyces sp. SID5470]
MSGATRESITFHDESHVVGGKGVRIFVIDRDPVFRAGIRAMVDSSPGVDLVGESATAGAVGTRLELLGATVDVCVMDPCFTGADGVPVRCSIEDLATMAARTRVLVLSGADEEAVIVPALRAGVRGYLRKGASQQEILRCLHVIAAGGAAFGVGTAERLSSFFDGAQPETSNAAFPFLTERERQVLDFLARGYTNRRIARTLVLSEKTVRNHVSHLLAKLQVNDRTEAALRAKEAGLGC